MVPCSIIQKENVSNVKQRAVLIFHKQKPPPHTYTRTYQYEQTLIYMKSPSKKPQKATTHNDDVFCVCSANCYYIKARYTCFINMCEAYYC